MKSLVIVDVQREFSNHFNSGYLEKLEKFITDNKASWDSIIVVFSEPEQFSDKRVIPRFLQNAGTLFIEKIFYYAEIDWISENGYTEVDPEKVWQDKQGNIVTFVIHSDGVGDYFVSPNELTKVSRELDTIDIVGGALGHCLTDVKSIFDHAGTLVNVIEDMSYHLNWENLNSDNSYNTIEDYCWVEVPEYS
jgi:hypothetical protein